MTGLTSLKEVRFLCESCTHVIHVMSRQSHLLSCIKYGSKRGEALKPSSVKDDMAEEFIQQAKGINDACGGGVWLSC